MSGNGMNGWPDTPAGHGLQQRLHDERTLLALTRLLDRIDSLEKTVDTLTQAIEQAPSMAAMVGDIVDEGYRSAAAQGIDVEVRLRTALQLADRLTAPEMVARLDQLLALANQAPGMAAMVGDIVDEGYRSAAAQGIDVEARLRTALALADKLTAPEMVARMDQLLALADQAPGMAAMVGDIVDESYRTAAAKGIDIEERLREALGLAERLTAPEMIVSLKA
ncbi:MAG: hypothetical protein KDE59_28915, partial [Anaerolineales bacterium]|nr:hypothetical protein [Anaerolineales bacterium]